MCWISGTSFGEKAKQKLSDFMDFYVCFVAFLPPPSLIKTCISVQYFSFLLNVYTFDLGIGLNTFTLNVISETYEVEDGSVLSESIKKAIETLKTNKIRWVHSAFVDVRGILQDMVLPAREYLSSAAFTEGIGFDGSSVRGFKSIEESDMIFMPDAKTLAIMPST